MVWNVLLFGEVGFIVVEIMNEVVVGNVYGIYIMGENFMFSDLDIGYVCEVFEMVDFLVV